MIESSCQIRVRYAETDQMAVVYHGNYFAWFETGRVHMLDELGYPYRELEKEGYLLPVLECSAKFFQPARFDDTLTILTRIAERPRLRIPIAYHVLRGETLLATGETLHAFVSGEGHPIRPPKRFSALMERCFTRSD